MTFVFLLFFGLLLGLTVLPLLPAILEWTKPTDTAPLSVVQESEVDIRHLASGFRSWVSKSLAEPLARVRASGHPQEGSCDGTAYRVVGQADGVVDDEERQRRRVDRVLASPADLRIPDGVTLAREAYAAGSVTVGRGAICRAVLAGGDIALGPETRTLRWLHADGSVLLGAGAHSHGRVSAGEEIVLGPGSAFERLNAPRIVVESTLEDAPRLGADLPVLRPTDVREGVVVDPAAGRWLIKGNAEIPPAVRVEVDLVVTGRCRIRQGALLVGSVKSHDDLVLESRIEAQGSLVSERDVRIGPGCRIAGPIVGERAIAIAGGTVVGTKPAPTTVSAVDLELERGVVVHGTVWAHRRGTVSAKATPMPAEVAEPAEPAGAGGPA